MTRPKIYDQDIQSILREIYTSNYSAIYERNSLGGTNKYVYVKGDMLKELLLEKKKTTCLYLKGGQRKKWWKDNLSEARKLAKSLHLPGPNIKDVAPVLTPEIAEVVTVEGYEHDPDFQPILQEILDYLADGGYITRHPSHPRRYHINGLGGAHLIK